jgi:hypothetical protein
LRRADKAIRAQSSCSIESIDNVDIRSLFSAEVAIESDATIT